LKEATKRNLVNATLSFTTAASSGVWTWGGGQGSSIQLIGGVDLNDDGDAEDPEDIPIGSTLINGEFEFASVAYFSGSFHINGGAFTDIFMRACVFCQPIPSILIPP
jgi:hypothetical protein